MSIINGKLSYLLYVCIYEREVKYLVYLCIHVNTYSYKHSILLGSILDSPSFMLYLLILIKSYNFVLMASFTLIP